MLEKIDEASWKELDKLAQDNKHQLWAPTHVIRKEGVVCGGVSIGGIPLVNVFFANQIKASDTFVVQDAIEKEVRANGWEDYLVTLGEESPMYKHASKWGLVELGSTLLHYRKINQ